MYLVKNYTWHKIAEAEADLPFAPNGIAVVAVDGKKICIAGLRGGLYAFAHKCPHAGGLLSEGRIDPRGWVACPVHGYKFSLQNGRNTSGEGFLLRHWPVERRPDGIYVGLEENPLLGSII